MVNFKSRYASHVLYSGGVIAYPTEGVWGFGCLVGNQYGAAQILALKKRSVAKGMILVASDISQLADYLTGLEPVQINKLDESWPGPVTWLIPDNGVAPAWVVGENDTLAVRVSAHPVIQAICSATGAAMISTSANTSGREPARNILRLRQTFIRGIDYIYPGELGSLDRPTEIRHLETNQIIRAG